MRIYVSVARSWAVFNVCCNSAPEVSRFSGILDFACLRGLEAFLSTAPRTECESGSPFSCDPLLLIWSLVWDGGSIWDREHSVIFWLSLSLPVGLHLRALTFTSVFVYSFCSLTLSLAVAITIYLSDVLLPLFFSFFFLLPFDYVFFTFSLLLDWGCLDGARAGRIPFLRLR